MGRIPTITKNLLIINILAFMAMLVFGQLNIADLNELLGLHYFMAPDFHIYQLFTYMFMHGGWEHIILNMLMLWMFGMVVEQTWGPKRFLFYYIICGIGAGILQEITQWVCVNYIFTDPVQAMMVYNSTTVGASGAIYALLLAFGMMFPNERMFIIPIPIPIKAKWMVMGSIVIELFSAMATPGDNVAHLAHLGGMLFGFLLIRHWQRHPGYGAGYGAGTQFFSRMKARWEQNSQRTNTKRGGTKRTDAQTHTRNHATTNPDWDYNAQKKASQEEIDRILDKIRKSGYDSLSKDEKQTLFDQSKK